MPVYSNEEEKKRRKLSDYGVTAEKSIKPVSTPLIGRGGTGIGEMSRFAKEGFREAAAQPTFAGKAGKAARTAVTLPVAAAYGALKEPAGQAARLAGGAKEFASAFFSRGDKAPQAAQPSASVFQGQTAAGGALPPGQAARLGAAAPVQAARREAGRITSAGGRITTSAGGIVGIGPDGEVIRSGPQLRPGPSIDQSSFIEGGVLRKVTRGAGTGGADKIELSRAGDARYGRQLQVGGVPRRRAVEQEPAAPMRVSDIAAPRTIGAVPGYRRQVEAARADIASEQERRRLAQGQRQFEAGQAQEQRQFEGRQGLEERRLAGTEQQQQLAAAQQEARLASEQRREMTAAEKETQISAARTRFDEAETPAEKTAAAQMLNALQGMRVELPKQEKQTGLSEKETSQQVQGALKIFNEAGGEAAAGTDFHSWMRQNDPVGYSAAFGNLSPTDISNYNEIQTLSDEDLKKSALGAKMRPGETAAQLRRRLDIEFSRKRGY